MEELNVTHVLDNEELQHAEDNTLSTTPTPSEEASTNESGAFVQEVNYEEKSREELVDELKNLMQQDIQTVKNLVASVRIAFISKTKELQQQALEQYLANGGDRESYEEMSDSVSEEFSKLYDTYRQRRQKLHEEVEEQKKKNYEAKLALIEELRQLVDVNEESVKASLDKFNAVQDKWKAIGDVPREKMNDLWQTYHFQIEQFFNKLKINRELRALDQKKNLEDKIQLCEQAEELIVEESITKAFKGLQDLRARWKEIGPVPTEQNDEIWQRFCNAANQIDQRRKEYYESRKEEMNNNLLAKQALVDKAIDLVATTPQSAKDWNELTAALDELLKVWKTIGPVPHEVNEEIWGKFKGIIDKHYGEKKEYFSNIREEQDQNYHKKIDLCLKAEAIAKREDWKKATEELLQLQAEWKSIGTTSRKVSDKVWQRFRAACDEFFAKKGEYYKERRSSEKENLEKKEAIIRQLKEYSFGTDKTENLKAIKDFQRQWSEIGFVPMSDKERLQQAYRQELDRIFEQLKISAREAEESAYREKLKSYGGDAKRFISNERQELQEKIEKLRNDLSLWENNLGFLANSKQADLLKEEFEKKMQNARQQIALQQAKLKILIESEKKSKEDEIKGDVDASK
ncbi:MAG: DUF349 domain-containing protein [Bacteroidales bacterium]|nr:DUF349 domain-containing protein [Bacteroidales bacterium]